MIRKRWSAFMNNRFEGKIVLVTGGSSGIGLTTAKQFVSEGATVFITGRLQAGGGRGDGRSQLEQSARSVRRPLHPGRSSIRRSTHDRTSSRGEWTGPAPRRRKTVY